MSTVTVAEDDGVATITLSRPDRLNALSTPMLESLYMILSDVTDRDDIDAVLLHGDGNGFCAGADLHEMRDWDTEDAEEHASLTRDIAALLEESGVMSVAAIHGPCLGGGNELAMACDFRIASRDATFGQPEVKLGLIPGFGGTARLPRIVGVAHANRLILTGERIDAAEAERIGLVHDVVARDALLDEARSLIDAVTGTVSMTAYRDAKRLLARSMDRDEDEALDAERDVFAARFDTHDAWEGINAFIKDRDPEFTGD